MNATIALEKKEILTFSVAVLALSALICFVSYRIGDPNVSFLSVFTPSLAALFLTAGTRGKKGVSDLFVRQTIQKTSPRWMLLSILGIPALAALAVLTSLRFDVGGFDLRTTQLLPQVIVIPLIALGEEYGWRGFLLPRLMRRFSVFQASLILGFLWGIWHFPAYLIGTGVPANMDFTVFLLWVVIGTFFMSWIYHSTKSVLTAILIHIGANAAFNYLPLLPEFTGSMTEFWVFLVYLSAFVIAIYWVKRKDFFKNPSR